MESHIVLKNPILVTFNQNLWVLPLFLTITTSPCSWFLGYGTLEKKSSPWSSLPYGKVNSTQFLTGVQGREGWSNKQCKGFRCVLQRENVQSIFCEKLELMNKSVPLSPSGYSWRLLSARAAACWWKAVVPLNGNTEMWALCQQHKVLLFA